MTDHAKNWHQQYALYLPRILVSWQSQPEPPPILEIEGTFLLVDISGFTAMSEMLAEKGKVGAEEVTEILNHAFTELLGIAMLDGGDLLRFGGDALFHLYTGDDHAARACRSALDMRDALEEFQRTKSPSPLEMSVGIASGPIHGFLAGSTSKELLFVGPTASEVVRLQTDARPGEILVSPSTVGMIDDDIFGEEKHGGFLLEDEPEVDDLHEDHGVKAEGVNLAQFIPLRLRDHLSLTFNEGEHRPATVAFVGFNGTDAAFAEGDLDGLASKLQALVSTTQDAAQRHGICFLASDVNDDGGKLILTTGVPERSVGHGERLLNALQDIVNANLDLPIHIGVARGHVFAGDLGARFRRVYTVMGDTVNLAARLAAKAGPGEIYCTARALDQALDTFETTQVDPIDLKGKSKPVAPLKIGAQIETVDEVRQTTELGLIGRESEVAQLVEFAHQAEAGDGRIVQVIAAAGMGKSRVVGEAVSRLGPTFGEYEVHCDRYESATAYHAAGTLLRHILELKMTDDSDRLGANLSATIAEQCADLTAWVPLLADVIGATVPSTPEVDSLADQFRDNRTREVTVDLLKRFLTAPTIIVIDDAQWMDEASQTMVASVAEAARDQPWLVLVLRNSEQSTDGEAGPDDEHMTTIDLGPLGHDDAVRLVTAIAGDDTPLPLAEAIAERAGGNPFFIVELARSGVTLEGSMPENVEAITLASIDRLDPRDRRLLRYASVFGERFDLDLLADALPEVAPSLDDMQVWHRLDEFIDTSSIGKVQFRQTIVRDVAYEGLPYRRRRDIHRAIGEALERRARRRPERYAELLSVHFDRAEEWAKSWEFTRMAGERAAKKLAHLEAMRLFNRALRAADHLEDLDPNDRVLVGEALGDAGEHAGLFDRAEKAYEHALEYAASDPLATGRILRKQGFLCIDRGDLDGAAPFLERSLETLKADDQTTIQARLETLIAIAGLHFRKGEYEDAADWCTKALEGADDQTHESEIAHAYYLRSAAYSHLPGQDGSDDAKHALTVYEEVKDLFGQATVLNNLGYDSYYKGDWDEAIEYWTRSQETSEKSGDINRTASSIHNLGEIFLDQGRYDEVEDRLRRALRMWRGAGIGIGVALANANLARYHTRTGNLELAEAHLDTARAGFADAGAAGYVIEEAIRRCEWLLFSQRPEEALELSDASLVTAAGAPGTESTQAALQRIAGYSLLALGDEPSAAERFELSAELAETSGARFELAQTVEAECRMRLGDHGDLATQCHELFGSLGVVARPVVPLPSRKSQNI